MNAQPQAQAGSAAAQPAQFENPMGIDGFEFVEFASPEPAALHELFRKLGFVQVARHKTRPIYNYRQNDCTFLINEDPGFVRRRFRRARTARVPAASRSASTSSPSGCACRR